MRLELFGERSGEGLLEFTKISGEDQEQAVVLLANEFFPESFQQGYEKFWTQACDSSTKLLCMSNNEHGIIGASVYKVYDWNKISPQLYLQACFDKRELEVIRLRSFRDLLLDSGFKPEYRLVAEMAYNVVKPKFRGKGLGRYLFEERLRLILMDKNVDLLFTLAMSPYASAEVNKFVTKYLIESEEMVHGKKDDGVVNVKGLWVNTSDLGEKIGLNLSGIDFETGSMATIHLSRSFGFVPLGFSRNLSPLWVKEANGVSNILL